MHKFLPFIIFALFLCQFPAFSDEEPVPAADEQAEPADKPAADVKAKKNVVIKWDPENREVSELIPLKYMDYKTVEQVCRPWLSKTGTMGHLPERQAVIVHDFKKIADKIRKFIEDAEAPLAGIADVNIRIDVDFEGSSKSSRANLYGKLNYPPGTPPGTIVIKNGKVVKPDSISIGATQNSGYSTDNVSQFIVTMSGRPASLWVGKTIVDPSWMNYCQFTPTVYIPAGGGATVIVPGNNPDIVWANVGSSLWVRPTYLGNNLIEVEVFPVVSCLDGKGKRQNIKVQSVSTTVTVRDGQRISIGGVVNSKKDFYTSFFGPEFISGDGRTSVLDIYLTARVMKPRESPEAPGLPKFR